MKKNLAKEELVSWCSEPSQPLGIISGLEKKKEKKSWEEERREEKEREKKNWEAEERKKNWEEEELVNKLVFWALSNTGNYIRAWKKEEEEKEEKEEEEEEEEVEWRQQPEHQE